MLGERPRDAHVKDELERRAIGAVYLLDKPRIAAASPEEKRSWYQDNDHLTPAGHAVWGELIGEDLRRALSRPGAPAPGPSARGEP